MECVFLVDGEEERADAVDDGFRGAGCAGGVVDYHGVLEADSDERWCGR